MSQITEIQAYRACRTLFGPDLQFNRDFLHYLQPSGVRSAYRNKAKAIHPDRFAVAEQRIKEKQQRLFQDLSLAYETVQQFLKQRDRFCPAKNHRSPAASPAQPQRRSGPRSRSQYYRGPLPARPLQFGLFLYYQGTIPFNAVISAISWQRQQRPTIGEIARRWGWLNDVQIRQVLNLRKAGARFGERAEQLDLLSQLQVKALLLHQRSRQKQMGEFFIEQGFFDAETLNLLLGKLAEHNRTYRREFGGQYYYHHRS